MTNDEAVKKFSDLVFVLAKARTRQLSDAEDVYQEVFCRYIDKKPKFRDDDHAPTWRKAIWKTSFPTRIF